MSSYSPFLARFKQIAIACVCWTSDETQIVVGGELHGSIEVSENNRSCLYIIQGKTKRVRAELLTGLQSARKSEVVMDFSHGERRGVRCSRFRNGRVVFSECTTAGRHAVLLTHMRVSRNVRMEGLQYSKFSRSRFRHLPISLL